MKKSILSAFIFFAAVPICTAIAFASTDDTLRVGLYYDGSGSNGALVSANLENHVGAGYQFGYYDAANQFIVLGDTDETQISMSQDLNLYVQEDGSYTTTEVPGAPLIGCHHLQLMDPFETYEDAFAKAEELQAIYGEAFPVYENGAFYVRVGSFSSAKDAAALLDSSGLAAAVSSGTAYTVTVTKSRTNDILFEYDDGGDTFLGIEPRHTGSEKPETWFKGYRYYGGFEYDRSPKYSSGRINVINVVDLEDYVKGVVPFEMSPSWPEEALKAQAVCARSFALCQTKHRSRNFDVCATNNCQVYHGASGADPRSDAAVDATAGEKLYYDGKVIEPPYYSSNGGASEDSENVWSNPMPYLRGKQDPYEAMIEIPNYTYEMTYTGEELGRRLRTKGRSIGAVISAEPTYTKQGNMLSIVFRDAEGNTTEMTKESCRLLLGAKSMHFTITAEHAVPVEPEAASGLRGFFALFGKAADAPVSDALNNGERTPMEQVLSGGNTPAGKTAPVSGEIVFTVRGSGWGHNVGMSQYGAKAYAMQGGTYQDILHFYYTGAVIQ